MIGPYVKKHRKQSILVLLFVGFLVDYLDRMVMSVAVVPIKAEFGLNATEIGVILSSFFFSYAIMQIPGGWLSDKLGSRSIILWSVIIWSVFTVATGFAWSFISLILVRVLFGIGQGGYPSATQKGIADFFEHKERPNASAILMSSNYFGMAFAPLVAAPLLVIMGWRNMFIVLGAVGVVMFYFYWRYYRLPQNEKQEKHIILHKVPNKEWLLNAEVWKITIMWFGAGIVNWGLASWIPSYLSEVRGMNLLSTGFIAALPGITTGVMMLFNGWILDKFFVDREKYFAAAGMVLSAISLYLMFTSESIVAAIIYMNLCMVFKSFAFTVAFSLPHKLMSKRVIGSAMGIINMGAQAAGFLSPLLMGMLITKFSYNAAFWFLIGSCILSIIATVVIRKPSTVDIKILEAENQAI
ncbi:MFS transporter [Terrilactibacillus laevilacticus]|uniref:MFS transporter n=1 Tax=Terrilactibacillus laevilacticus TaxID=1380157 RepID=A0ABW5PMV3_9BACI|nr:MFS transporter [Terrilactibacillus laevilacticus]